MNCQHQKDFLDLLRKSPGSYINFITLQTTYKNYETVIIS